MLGYPFYHGHIRKFVAAFGSLFDNIKIATINGSGQIVRASTVPIRYAGSDKGLMSANPEDKPYSEIYPRMSFEWIGFNYDPDRKLNPNNSINGIKAPTPYVIEMGLYILARNMNDALQIVEQIIPFFNPTLTIQMENSPLRGVKTDIPVTLKAVSVTDDYEGEEAKARRIEITFNFEAIIDFYKNVGSDYENALVNFIQANYDPEDPTSCTPPNNPHYNLKPNRIETIYVNFYTDPSNFCALFDENPNNDEGITPEESILVEATPDEIRQHDSPSSN